MIKREKTIYNEEDNSKLIVPECIKDAVDLEGNAGNWSLMHRYQKVRDCLFLLDLENPKESLWIYIWLKYSFRRILTWQRQFNTPPKDLQWSMHCLTFELTKRFSELYSSSHILQSCTFHLFCHLSQSLLQHQFHTRLKFYYTFSPKLQVYHQSVGAHNITLRYVGMHTNT